MKNMNTRTLTRVALLVAIELVMKAVGLGSVPMGPLYMSFLTLPIAVGAITMGPAVGAILGGVFGAVSFYDAITGASAMTGALFQVSPLNTFILCVGMRVLMGLCVGLIFSGLKRFDKPGTWSYILSAMCARPSTPCSSWATSCWPSTAATMCRIWCRSRAQPTPSCSWCSWWASRAWRSSWCPASWAASWPVLWQSI